MSEEKYNTPAKRLRADIADEVIYTDMFARGYNYPASMKGDITSVLDELRAFKEMNLWQRLKWALFG